MEKTTICAIATAPEGALGIVRVSGPKAIEITEHYHNIFGKIF